jgi:hypothetical protein
MYATRIIVTVPTEESQADKGIDHPIVLCEKCGTRWRSHVQSLCPTDTCEEELGVRMFLTGRQNSNLYVAVHNMDDLFPLCLTQPQMGFEFGKFRALLYEDAPWYDRTNRQMVQACYQSICDRMEGPSLQYELAIAFFKEDYKWASDDKKTFCPEADC